MAGPDGDVGAEKEALRSAVLTARSTRTEAGRVDAGRLLAEYGAARWSGPQVVAAYLSFGSEPPTGPLLQSLVASEVEVLVPVVDGNRLDWARYDPAGTPAPGSLGIPEPTGPRRGADALLTAAVILVPALAVDRRGNRLGRGRGYYDRALAGVTAPVVAVVYDEELLEAVPVAPHDHRVDAILTPSGWVDVTGA